MGAQHIESALRILESEVAIIDPDRLDPGQARRLVDLFTRVERTGAAGVALLARCIDPAVLARQTGTPVGKARSVVGLSQRLRDTPDLAAAVRSSVVSLDQATEIAKAETAAPGSAAHLIETARDQPFHVLKEQARSAALSSTHTELVDRQHRARRLTHRVTDLGMIRIEADLEPHVGVPIVNRLERAARTRAGADRRDQPFAAHMADALAEVMAVGGTTGKTEMVILISHEVAARGWTEVGEGEHCKIPGIGPVDPKVAKALADDAFLSGVFFDGEDLRQIKSWTRGIPAPVRRALNLGAPPRFDGPRCVDCGNRLRLEADHDIPFSEGGPTSLENLPLRCGPCHLRKTVSERRNRVRGAGRAAAAERAPPEQ